MVRMVGRAKVDWFWVLLLSIVVMSWSVRLTIVDHGLPDVQVGDENSDLSAILNLAQGEIPPRHVRYHRSLIAYVNGIAVGGVFGMHYFTGRVSSLDEFEYLYFADRGMFTLATRILVASLTVGAIFLSGLIGRYINDRTGILAALLFALHSFSTLNSVYALPDGIVLAAVALFLWMMLRVWRSRKIRDFSFAGLSFSLVMLSKFSGTAVGVAFLIVYVGIVRKKAKGDPRTFIKKLFLNRKLAIFVLGAVLGNVLFNPLAFLYPEDLVWEIQYLSQHAYIPVRFDAMLQNIFLNIIQIIPIVWRWLLPASVVAFIAAYYYRHNIIYWAILGAFSALTITIARINNFHTISFYWTPWIIPMILLSAMGLNALFQWTKNHPIRHAVYAAVVLIVVFEGAHLLSTVRLFLTPTTFELAQTYVEENIPPDTRIMIGSTRAYSVPLTRNEASIELARSLGAVDLAYWEWWLSLDETERPSPAYYLFGPEMQKKIKTFADVGKVVNQEQIAYVVESTLCWGDLRPESNSALDFPALNEELRRSWELAATFSPFDEVTCEGEINDRNGLTLDMALRSRQLRRGPLIRIYATEFAADETHY